VVAVLTGVSAGDLVVSAGAIKLRNGAPARLDNSVQPATDVNPKPANP
jgi:membrane fusion protein (multidrug efflux system)